MTRARGFTLIEVMIAITIAGIVVVTAHQLFAAVADGAKAVTAARQALDHDANARRWLKATFLSVMPPFEGRADRASFTSWQLTPGGWFEPQPIRLLRDSAGFVATGAGQPLLLATGVDEIAFDYLLEPGANSRWVREWISPVSAPFAVRLRIVGCGRQDRECVDTLLFLVQERG